MKKIKVLQFSIGNIKGGTTQYVLNNWEYIDKNKFQFDFVTMSKTLDFENDLNKQGCKIYYISCYGEENEAQFICEMDQILSQGYDVIHLHTNCWKSFLVEELAKKHNIPKIIVHSHNTMVLVDDEEQRKKAVKLHQLRRSQFTTELATDLWACSHLAADWLFGEQIPKEKIVIMKNAIDVEKFIFNNTIRLKYRKEFGFNDSFVIGHVGRFAYQKNHEFLINVFKLVRERINNAKLLLVGVGSLEGQIREKVKDCNMQNDVVFLGKRDDVNYIMQAMDVFCLPSRFEGLPITLIEAQCTGIKCLASNCITKEAKITDNIKFLSLNKTIWVKQILQTSCSYDRKNMNDKVSEAGYNIKDQIKEIEKMYEN